jgi:hypothetical protein
VVLSRIREARLVSTEFGGHYQSPFRETAGIIEVLSFIAVGSRTRDIAAMASGSLAAGCAASICSAVSHRQASPYRLPGQLGPGAFISATRCSEPGPHLVGVAVPEVGEDLESSLPGRSGLSRFACGPVCVA